MTLVLIGKGLVLGGWPSKIEVIWVPGVYREREREKEIFFKTPLITSRAPSWRHAETPKYAPHGTGLLDEIQHPACWQTTSWCNKQTNGWKGQKILRMSDHHFVASSFLEILFCVFFLATSFPNNFFTAPLKIIQYSNASFRNVEGKPHEFLHAPLESYHWNTSSGSMFQPEKTPRLRFGLSAFWGFQTPIFGV